MSFEAVGVKLVAENDDVYFATMNKAQGAVDDFGGNSKKVFSQMPGLADIAVGAFHAIGTVAVDAFFKAGQAAVGFFTDSIGAAGDFEAGMNRVSIAVGDGLEGTGLKLDDFKKDFLAIGKELPVSTQEVQDSFVELVKGGIDPVALHMGGLKSSIQFATAAELDLTEAAELSARQLGVWTKAGASAEEQAKFLAESQEILVKAANASTVGVKDLAQGMNVAGGIASALNIDYKDFATTMAQIAPAFNSTLEAGTGYKNFLARLQPATNPAKDAMKELGLWTRESGSAFFDAEGKYVGNREAAELLKKATSGLTDAKKAEMFQTIFGNDAMGAANKLANDGAAGYDAMAKKIAEATGVQAAATTMQQGYNVALDNFHGSIEALQITIGSLLLPVLSSLFNDYLSPGINTLTTLASAITGDDEAFNSLSPTLQTLIQWFDELSLYVNRLVQYFGYVIEDGDYLNDILTTLPEPIQPLVEAIGYLITMFQSVGNEGVELGGVIDQLSGIWNNYFAVISEVVNAFQNIIMAVFGAVAEFLAENGDQMLADISDVWDQIVDVINLALALYKAIVPPILNTVAAFISDHTEELKLIFGGAWKIITGIIDGALTLIKGILSAALKILQGDWEGAWQDIQDMSARFVADILQVISGGLDLIKGAFDVIIDAIQGAFADFIGNATGIGEDIINGIIDGIQDSADRLFDVLRSLAEDALQAAMDALDIGSPSKAFRKQVGRQIPIGAALGVMDTMPMLTRTLQAGMASTVASSASMIAGATTNATYNQQRSINMTYNTTHAPNAAMNYAIAQALL